MISPKKQRGLPAQGATPQKPATGQESGFCPCCGDAMGETDKQILADALIDMLRTFEGGDDEPIACEAARHALKRVGINRDKNESEG